MLAHEISPSNVVVAKLDPKPDGEVVEPPAKTVESSDKTGEPSESDELLAKTGDSALAVAAAAVVLMLASGAAALAARRRCA